MATAKHRVSSFPASRLATIDLGKVSRDKHHVVALVELDVTQALATIRAERKQGKSTSVLAWLAGTISRVLAEEPFAHALRLGKSNLVTFEDVDVSVVVEREVDGKKVPLPVLIRRCDKKSTSAIYAELEAAKTERIGGDGDFVLGEAQRRRRRMRLYAALPGWLRVRMLRWFADDPFRSQREMGTVVITSLGSMAPLPGWFIPSSIHNLCFAVGAIIKKPWVVGERIEPRDILHLTVLFDHDVIDGAPAARFLNRLASELQTQA